MGYAVLRFWRTGEGLARLLSYHRRYQGAWDTSLVPPGTQSKNKEILPLAARQGIRENVFSNHNSLPEPHGRLGIGGLKAPGVERRG
jgi:hypothetical protein